MYYKRKFKAFYDIYFKNNFVGYTTNVYFYYDEINLSILTSELTLLAINGLNASLLKDNYDIFVEKQLTTNDVYEKIEIKNGVELLEQSFRVFNKENFELKLARQGYEIIIDPHKNFFEKAYLIHDISQSLQAPFKVLQMEPIQSYKNKIIQQYIYTVSDEEIINSLKKTIELE